MNTTIIIPGGSEPQFSDRFEDTLGLANAATTSFNERDTSILTNAIKKYRDKYGKSGLTTSMLGSSRKSSDTWTNWLYTNQLNFIDGIFEALESGDIEPYSLAYSVMKGSFFDRFSLENQTDQNRQIVDAVAAVVDKIFDKGDLYDHIDWTIHQ